MAKRDFKPDGATCWQGGTCTHRGITRINRYITGGGGRKFESCPYSDDWFALGDTLDSYGRPFRYRVTGDKARALTRFFDENIRAAGIGVKGE